MNTLEVISKRRSIRKFKDLPLPEETLNIILKAATQAPSGKNRQPWKFILVREDKRREMVDTMRRGISKMKESGMDVGSSERSADIMEEAPVTIFIFNPYGKAPWLPHSVRESFENLVDIQSAGAAIQNMLLAAQELGVGSLWICNIFYAYEELCTWLGEEGEMVAAVSLGYPDEAPDARPRKPLEDVIRQL
ncbi:nitroreductase [Propionigenium maris DSM 9537]|uniref:Nitroreductase n=1 Tax=Propionigenium maris DSM 9537 TaxID=1123000 RepID=A0A9W6LNC8_9FUSO|nr:nitroreductase [Propionigenium maris]GLI56764.1 nitroreductase [Propionigenium maris DSM 9537]